jgi:hypothetical protein
MGYCLARQESFQGGDPSRMVKVAVGDKEQFYLFGPDSAGTDIGQQFIIGKAASGIHESRMAFKIDEIDGRIFRLAKRPSANLVDFIGDFYLAHLRIPHKTAVDFTSQLELRGTGLPQCC